MPYSPLLHDRERVPVAVGRRAARRCSPSRSRRARPTPPTTHPRFSMTAAPRFCTVSMNGALQPRVVADHLGRRLAVDLRVREVGELRGRVVAPDREVRDVAHRRRRPSSRAASWRGSRRDGSSRTSGRRGRRVRCDRAIRQFVLHGLPTTSTRTSLAAWSLIASPWGLKIPPLTMSRSPRSMPALRGIEPTSSAHDVPSNAVFRSAVASMPSSSGCAPSSSSMTTPSSDVIAGSISSRRSTTGWSGPRSWPRRDAVHERVADLAGGAGDGDVDGWLAAWRRSYPADAREPAEPSSVDEQQLAGLARARRCRSAAPSRVRAVVGVGEPDAAVGTGAARRCARRRCRRGGRAPPSPSGAPRGRRARPRVDRPRRPGARRARRERREARGRPGASRRTSTPSGSTPGRRERGVDGPERDPRVADGGSAAAAISAPMTCGSARPCTSSSSTSRGIAPSRRLGDDPVPRAVEPVGVGLEPVAQRDPRHREPVARVVQRSAAAASCCSSSSAGDELGDDRAEQHRAVRGAARRQVAVRRARRAGRHVPSGVPDVELGEDASRALPDRRSTGGRRWRDANSRRLHLGRAVHEPGEVVGDDLVGDGGLERADDVVGGVLPAEVLEHHHARQQHRARG